MATFYEKMATKAALLLAKYGQTATFRRYSVSSTTGGATTPTLTATVSIKVVVLPASQGTIQAFDNRREDEALATKQLRYLLVPGKGMTFEPRPDDQVTFAGKTWLLLGCTPTNPAGTPLLYGVGVVER